METKEALEKLEPHFKPFNFKDKAEFKATLWALLNRNAAVENIILVYGLSKLADGYFEGEKHGKDTD